MGTAFIMFMAASAFSMIVWSLSKFIETFANDVIAAVKHHRAMTRRLKGINK